jgi:hypothetical protein
MRNNETQPGVELLSSPAAIVRESTGVDEAKFHQLVQLKVAEIMAERDAVVFEPFFRSRQVAYELKRLQTIPEQTKFSVAFARYGCMICETRERIHAGNGLCTDCRALWFRRFVQIIAEGMTGDSAKPARGTPLAERRLLPNRPMDAPHRTFYQSTTPEVRAIFRRIATRLNVDPYHVRRVAFGKCTSEAVTAALNEEWEQMQKAADEKTESTHGRRPGTLASLARAREGKTRKNLADAGIPPELAAATLKDAKDAIMACMPKSKSRAMHAAALFEAAVVSSIATGRKALNELLAVGKIERFGEGTVGSRFRYFIGGTAKRETSPACSPHRKPGTPGRPSTQGGPKGENDDRSHS